MPTAQHYPNGLFPHIQSGFERTPYFPEAGKQMVLGCRVKNPAVPLLLAYAFDGIQQPDMEGTHAWDNESWTYYTFTVQPPDMPCRIEYAFISHGESITEPFFAESVTVADVLVMQNADAPLRWHIHRHQSVSISLFGNLSDKVIFNNDNETPHEPIILLSDGQGNRLAWMSPIVRLWLDRHNHAYQAELRCTVQAESLYGFGEKFDRVNQAGLSPLCYVVEQFANQQEKTYLPIPFFFTDSGAGFLLHGTWKTRFTTEVVDGGFIDISILTECPENGTLFDAELRTGSPAELLGWYTERTGAPALPPRWAFGPWMSSNGWNTQREALEQIQRMDELDIPAIVMVLEAWSDEETFYIWNDARYTPKTDGSAFRYDDFTFPPDGKWPDPRGFTEVLHQHDVKLVLWQIPVLKESSVSSGAQLEADKRYAVKHQLCVARPNGTPYRIPEMWFGGSLIPDFTNPETIRWWFDKRRYLVEELGVAGFKTDGGEFLFDRDSLLHDGRTIAQAHNDYPNLYIGAYHGFLNETAGPGNGVTFSRAGYSGAQRFPIYWAGDQVSTFSDLRGQLAAGLSLGLSGVPFWAFDIGGFAGDLPTTELYLRATAFAAFAPVMQFHSEPRSGQYDRTERQHLNNDRSPWNMAAANGDERIIPVYRKFAKLRMRLLPYLWQEAQHCVKTSRPMMAHLVYDFYADRRVHAIEDEYMLGRDLLIAPIVTAGAQGRTVYLPDGEWVDFWTGEPVRGAMEHDVECGLDSIPVYTLNKAMGSGEI
ncbi:MAG: glycosyl hydrolase [Clostridia bacterium]|nr:glycosyl hydrolase [Clostridia bacterium]